MHNAFKRVGKMRLSLFSITIIIILALAAVLFYAQLPHTTKSLGTTTVTSSQSNTNSYISRLKNLTYEYIYAPKNSEPVALVQMIGISSISTNSSNNTVKPGGLLGLHILYHGYFGFDTGQYNSSAFLRNTINLYYFGYRSPGANNLLVYDNVANVTKYFTLKNTSMEVPNGMNPANYLEETAYITPTANAIGKSWYFCGGIFVTYSNNTNSGGIFSKLSFNGTDIDNSSVLNYVSDNCTSVSVE